EDMLDDKIDLFAAKDIDADEWDMAALQRDLTQLFALSDEDSASASAGEPNSDELRNALWDKIVAKYEEKEKLVPRDILTRVERDLMLQVVDQHWKDHLYSLDHLKEGIGLRGYGQRDPLVEYKKESFEMFQAMKERIDEEIVRYLWWLRPVLAEDAAPVARRPAPRRQAPLILNDPAAELSAVGAASRAQ